MPLIHGTTSGYTYYKCRCEDCRKTVNEIRLARRQQVQEAVKNGTMPVPHGTTNGYSYYGCKCDECRKANAVDTNKRYHRRQAKALTFKSKNGKSKRILTGVTHGKHNTYNIGCRCDECIEAKSVYGYTLREKARKAFKAGLVNPGHGKINTYNYYGCRCDECREVNRVMHLNYINKVRNGYK